MKRLLLALALVLAAVFVVVGYATHRASRLIGHLLDKIDDELSRV